METVSIPLLLEHNMIMEKYILTKINSFIWKIEEAGYTEHANIFVIGDQKKCLVIDPGLGMGDLTGFVKKKLGFLEVKVILTHSHFDHSLGLIDFQKNKILLTRKIKKNLQDLTLFGIKYLKKKDFFDYQEYQESFTKVANFPNFFQGNFEIVDDKIKIGKYVLKILDSPGHTDDSIILYLEEAGIIFSGDTLYDGQIFSKCRNSSLSDFKTSLHTISKLKFNFIMPGHNETLSYSLAQSIIRKWQNDLIE